MPGAWHSSRRSFRCDAPLVSPSLLTRQLAGVGSGDNRQGWASLREAPSPAAPHTAGSRAGDVSQQAWGPTWVSPDCPLPGAHKSLLSPF